MALSDEKKKQMETYFKEGQSITSVARQVGVAYQTARKYKEMLEKEGEKEEQSAPEEEMSGECFNDLQTAFVPLLEDTPCPNPPQDILFQAVLGKYILKDVTPEHALYVGDSDVDIATAQNAGMECISVTWGFRDEEFLLQHGATNLIQQPLELLRYI